MIIRIIHRNLDKETEQTHDCLEVEKKGRIQEKLNFYKQGCAWEGGAYPCLCAPAGIASPSCKQSNTALLSTHQATVVCLCTDGAGVTGLWCGGVYFPLFAQEKGCAALSEVTFSVYFQSAKNVLIALHLSLSCNESQTELNSLQGKKWESHSNDIQMLSTDMQDETSGTNL